MPESPLLVVDDPSLLLLVDVPAETPGFRVNGALERAAGAHLVADGLQPVASTPVIATGTDAVLERYRDRFEVARTRLKPITQASPLSAVLEQDR